MQRLAVAIFVFEAAFVVAHVRGARVGEGLAFVCLVSISTTWRRRYCVLPTAQQISAAENEKGIGGAEAAPFALNNLHLNEGTARQASGMAGRHAGRQACRQANLLQNLHDTSQSVRKSLRGKMYL